MDKGPVGETLADGIEIWRGDFREVIPSSINQVDHIITDPPYEQRTHDNWSSTTIRRKDGYKTDKQISFDGVDHLREDIVVRTKMVNAGWFLVFCTTEGVAIWRDEIERHKTLKYRTPCIWIKPDAMPKFNGQGPSHGHECIVTAWCGAGYSRWNGGGRRGVFTHNCNPSTRDGRHETEKPVSLMLELVSLFSNVGDLVLDPFMGSGTTGIACIKLGRRFIGIERNPAYYAIAKERLVATLSQPDLFVDIPKQKQDTFSW